MLSGGLTIQFREGSFDSNLVKFVKFVNKSRELVATIITGMC